MPHQQIVELLRAKFQEGEEYPKEDIKQTLIEIYHSLGAKGKPSAMDIQRYFVINESSKRINKKKVATIEIISHWQTKLSVFRGIANRCIAPMLMPCLKRYKLAINYFKVTNCDLERYHRKALLRQGFFCYEASYATIITTFIFSPLYWTATTSQCHVLLTTLLYLK